MRVGDPPVGGRYSLVEPFGADERFAGGKVQTWRAHDSLVDRAVVLRVMTPGGNSAKLFLDRALEMSMIAHPGLGMVYDAVDLGEHAIVVCEWIDGVSLADTLKAHGPLTPATARKTLGDVAEAIAVAHHAGLPIGGITPERVVLRSNGSVTLTGVPALFADERGDIQQLGRLLFAALTGAEPTPEDPDVAKTLHRGVPRDLAVLCQRALETDPARQLGSAAAFAAVLRPRAAPPSPAGTTAGRAGERLGGIDGEQPPTPPHDTSPSLMPVAAGHGGGPPSTSSPPSLPPAPPTVLIPVGSSAPTKKPAVNTGPTRKIATPPVQAPPPPRQASQPDPFVAQARRALSLPSPPTQSIATQRPTAPARTDPAASPIGPPAPAIPTTRGGGRGRQRVRTPDRDDWAIDSGPRIESEGGNSPIPTVEDHDPWIEDTGTWGTYDDIEDDPDGDFEEGSQTRRKILLYSVPLAAVILVILIVVLVGKQFIDNVGPDNSPAVFPSSQPTPTGSAAATESGNPAGSPVAGPLPFASASVFNPFGDGGSEHNDDVGLTADGDPSTAWKTLTYESTPEFGNLKPGVGVIFDLGAEHTVTSVELGTNLPGSAIEIRVGAAPDAPLESYAVVGTLDPFTDSATVPLAEPAQARFVIVWFVRLVESNGGFQGALSECRVIGT